MTKYMVLLNNRIVAVGGRTAVERFSQKLEGSRVLVTDAEAGDKIGDVIYANKESEE